jgi:hypothetical protein
MGTPADRRCGPGYIDVGRVGGDDGSKTIKNNR